MLKSYVQYILLTCCLFILNTVSSQPGATGRFQRLPVMAGNLHCLIGPSFLTHLHIDRTPVIAEFR